MEANGTLDCPFADSVALFSFTRFQSLDHLLMKKWLREKFNERFMLDLQGINKQVISDNLHSGCMFPKQCSELIYLLYQKCKEIMSKAEIHSANTPAYILHIYFFFLMGNILLTSLIRLIPNL